MKAHREEVARRTLETIPERVLKFLRTVNAEPAILRALEDRGYSKAEQLEGWKRLHDATGFRENLPPEDTNDASVRSAIEELDAAKTLVFRIAKASLVHRYPRQAELLFHGVDSARGPASVLRLEILLDRLDALEIGAGREATRAEDLAVLKVIEQRALTATERTRLRQLIAIAKRAPPVTDSIDRKAEQRRQMERLAHLRHWYVEWSEIARAVVHRGDFLIRLGLASRRANKHPRSSGRSARSRERAQTSGSG